VNAGYVVLGVVLILMGVGQVYLRHFSGSDETEDGRGRQVPTRRGATGGRVWQGWTAILGFLGLVLGIVLVVLGVLGRG
jgi:hypothetical protein